MKKVEVLTDVPASKVDKLVAQFKAEGAKVEKVDEGDGEFTVIATFPKE